MKTFCMSTDIPLNDNSTPVTNSRTAKAPSDTNRELLNNIQIVNIEFEHLTNEQDKDMFQRIQL